MDAASGCYTPRPHEMTLISCHNRRTVREGLGRESKHPNGSGSQRCHGTTSDVQVMNDALLVDYRQKVRFGTPIETLH